MASNNIYSKKLKLDLKDLEDLDFNKLSFDDLQFTTPFKPTRKESVADQIEREKILKNDEYAQDIRLKKITLIVLFCFLGIETIAIFSIAFLQGFKCKGFFLEEWNFRILVTSTITQITIMLQIAVKHLFPQKKQ